MQSVMRVSCILFALFAAAIAAPGPSVTASSDPQPTSPACTLQCCQSVVPAVSVLELIDLLQAGDKVSSPTEIVGVTCVSLPNAGWYVNFRALLISCIY